MTAIVCALVIAYMFCLLHRLATKEYLSVGDFVFDSTVICGIESLFLWAKFMIAVLILDLLL